MQKSIGLSRTVRLDWLDAAATLCLENRLHAEIRQELDHLVEPAQPGEVERARIVDTLVRIWVKADPGLKSTALTLYPQLSSREDRLCLHYGLILAQYPFYRLCAAIVGQMARNQESVTRKLVKQKVAAAIGNLGSIERAVARLFLTWIDWGVITPLEKNRSFMVRLHSVAPSGLELEKWLVTCALKAHPSASLPFNDIRQLPELFPFRFNLSLAEIQKDPRFEVSRQGGGLDMVGIKSIIYPK